jgi:molybdopterin molybdotransferase
MRIGQSRYTRGVKTDVTLEEAIDILAGILPAPKVEQLALLEAHGRVLAQPLSSLVDHPSADDSALDGFAVRLEDTLAASAESPVRLRVLAQVAAGAAAVSLRLGPGQAVQVFTGASVPDGATGIVMVEHTARDGEFVLVSKPGTADIRKRGQDLERGGTYLHPGVILRGAQLALAAAMGHATLPVFERPRVGILATGDELLEPGEPLPPGGVYNSNSYGLAGLVRELGGQAVILPKVQDDPELLRSALNDAGDLHLLLSSGGVSMGERDFVRLLLEREGTVHFWRIRVKPGGPPLCGEWNGLPFFGLPGNPVSSLVIFLMVVKPALYKRWGILEPAFETIRAVAQTPIKGAGAKLGLMRVNLERVRLEPDAGLGWTVRSFGNQSSNVLRSMVEANGLAIVPPHTNIEIGDSLEVVRL